MTLGDEGGRAADLESRDDGDITFLAAEPQDLETVASVPQALDNQWIPRQQMARMISEGVPDDDEIERRRSHLVRQEYLRSLVTSGQVVINRAFCQNSPAINRDFAAPGPDRDAFISLLESRVIVPFLYRESTPLVRPVYFAREWEAWRGVIAESRSCCLRLSWESDEVNDTLTERYLSGPFADFLKTLDRLEVPLIAYELGLPVSEVLPLRDQLWAIARWSQQKFQEGVPLTRETLYRKFVTADDTPTALRRYDLKKKPFAAEIKQLLDLRYNANTPDALGSYLLTPDDSLGRRTLQEWGLDSRARGRATDAAQLTDSIRRLRFAQITKVLGGLAAFDFLTLSDVVRLRHTEEWHAYHRVLQQFISERSLAMFEDSDHGAQQVAAAYGRVIGVAGEIAGERLAEARVREWEPITELVVDFAGASVSIFFGGEGNVTYAVTGEIAKTAITRTAKAVISLVIGRFTKAGTKSRVGNSLRLLEYRFERGRRDWEEFVYALGAAGFQELTEASRGQNARLEKTIDE